MSFMSEIRKLPNEEICLTNDVISGKATGLACREGASNPSVAFPGMQRSSRLCKISGKEDAAEAAVGAACLAPDPQNELQALTHLCRVWKGTFTPRGHRLLSTSLHAWRLREPIHCCTEVVDIPTPLLPSIPLALEGREDQCNIHSQILLKISQDKPSYWTVFHQHP